MSESARRYDWRRTIPWVGVGIGVSLIAALARRAFGSHLGAVVLSAPIAFTIVYLGMRRSQGASRLAATVIAFTLASVAAAWFYLIGI